jgi:hypothetical protein
VALQRMLGLWNFEISEVSPTESMVDEKALRGLEPQWDGFAGCVALMVAPGIAFGCVRRLSRIP